MTHIFYGCLTLVGNNLFETIVENMVSITEAGSIDYGLGLAPWRIDGTVIPKKQFANVSLIEAYTWMPRRITLCCDSNNIIHTVFIQQGHDFKGNNLWRDPHVPYILKDDSYLPLRPVLGRQLWRDVATLTYCENSEKSPFVLFRFKEMMEDELPQFIPVRLLGLVLENGKYHIWYEDDLSLPKIVIENDKAAYLLRYDVSSIEWISNELFKNVKNRVDKSRLKSDTKEHEIAVQCQQHFLHGAHDLLFGPAMDEICGSVPDKEHVEHFCEAVKGLLRETISQVLRASGSDAKAMMQQMEAEKWIWISWKKQTEERMKAYAGS